MSDCLQPSLPCPNATPVPAQTMPSCRRRLPLPFPFPCLTQLPALALAAHRAPVRVWHSGGGADRRVGACSQTGSSNAAAGGCVPIPWYPCCSLLPRLPLPTPRRDLKSGNLLVDANWVTKVRWEWETQQAQQAQQAHL